MPSSSRQQQRLFGLVHAAQNGKVPIGKLNGKARELAMRMDPQDVTEFAETKHDKIPESKKAAIAFFAIRAAEKRADFSAALRKAESAVHGATMSRQKALEDANNQLRQTASSMQQQISQLQSNANQAAMANQAPPPAAQPPFGQASVMANQATDSPAGGGTTAPSIGPAPTLGGPKAPGGSSGAGGTGGASALSAGAPKAP